MLSARKGSSLKILGVLFAATLLANFCWPTNLLAANTDVNVQVCPSTPHPPPVLTAPADGAKTEESSILMSGSTTPNVVVYAYRNDVQVGFVSSGGDGTFAISISLDMGTNVLKASTNNECNASAFSGSVTVEREISLAPPESEPDDQEDSSTEKPGEPTAGQPIGVLPPSGQPEQGEPGADQPPGSPQRPVIREPKNGERVTSPFILVVGEASPHTIVRVQRNGQIVAEVLSDDEGHFTVGITLEQGENHIVVTTGQGADARSSEPVVVTYEPLRAASTSTRWWLVLFFFTGSGVAIGLLMYSLWKSAFGLRFRRMLKKLRGGKHGR